MELINKIERMRSDFDNESQSDLDAWVKELEHLEAVKKLKENMVIVDFLNTLKHSIETMDKELLEKLSSSLPDVERDRLIERKQLFRQFIGVFEGVEEKEKAIEKIITQYESNQNG